MPLWEFDTTLARWWALQRYSVTAPPLSSNRFNHTLRQMNGNWCHRRNPMLIIGKCHCGNIAFTLDWPEDQPDVPARACDCSFCTKHGGVWTSNPRAKLSVVLQHTDLVSKYAFGTETATFHVCTRCGTVPIVTSEVENHRYAVVNVNTFENFDPSRLHRATASFDNEDVDSRLARRRKNWIADVRIS